MTWAKQQSWSHRPVVAVVQPTTLDLSAAHWPKPATRIFRSSPSTWSVWRKIRDLNSHQAWSSMVCMPWNSETSSCAVSTVCAHTKRYRDLPTHCMKNGKNVSLTLLATPRFCPTVNIAKCAVRSSATLTICQWRMRKSRVSVWLERSLSSSFRLPTTILWICSNPKALRQSYRIWPISYCTAATIRISRRIILELPQNPSASTICSSASLSGYARMQGMNLQRVNILSQLHIFRIWQNRQSISSPAVTRPAKAGS